MSNERTILKKDYNHKETKENITMQKYYGMSTVCPFCKVALENYEVTDTDTEFQPSNDLEIAIDISAECPKCEKLFGWREVHTVALNEETLNEVKEFEQTW